MISAVWKLIVLSDNCSFQTLVFLGEYRENATSFQAVCKHCVGGATSLHKTNDRSYFRSPDIGVRIIDVPDNWSFYWSSRASILKPTVNLPTSSQVQLSIAMIEGMVFPFGNSQPLESQSGLYSTIPNCLTTHSKPDLQYFTSLCFSVYLTTRKPCLCFDLYLAAT